MTPDPLRTVFLISGGGRTLQNFIDLRAAGRMPIDIPLVIGSRADIGGMNRVRDAGLNAAVADRRRFTTSAEFSRHVFSLCDQAGAGLICLAGWLSLLEVPDRYLGRIMNIHPALLPSFGGKGMWGHHVHQAVIDHGCKISGCTVHFVDNSYDTGPIILQRTCPVLDDDTADTLARRVFDQEVLAYPEAVRLFAEGKLKVDGRRVRRPNSPI
jgi:phosphoribosylglycinamide formyltransferase-1